MTDDGSGVTVIDDVAALDIRAAMSLRSTQGVHRVPNIDLARPG